MRWGGEVVGILVHLEVYFSNKFNGFGKFEVVAGIKVYDLCKP